MCVEITMPDVREDGDGRAGGEGGDHEQEDGGMMDAFRWLAPAFALGVMVGFALSDRLNRSFWYEAGRLDARIGRLEQEIRDRDREGEEWKNA